MQKQNVEWKGVLVVLRKLQRRYKGRLTPKERIELEKLIARIEVRLERGISPGRELAKRALSAVAKIVTAMGLAKLLEHWSNLS